MPKCSVIVHTSTAYARRLQMQTFLPFHNYKDSANALDSKRLNKQAVECQQIAEILLRKMNLLPLEYKKDRYGHSRVRKGFWNHPAVRMWEGWEGSYFEYYRAVVFACQQRGIESSKHMDKYLTYAHLMDDVFYQSDTNALLRFRPHWQVEEFHLSHRYMLWRKDPAFYSHFYASLFSEPHLDYLWPAVPATQSHKFQNPTLYERYHNYVNSGRPTPRPAVL